MDSHLIDKTVRQYVDGISDQYYPMTGSVIAVMAAQAAALAEACVQISLDNQVDKLDWQDVTTRIEQLAHIKSTLLEWSNQDISTGRTDNPPAADNGNQNALFDYAVEIAKLSLEAAEKLQDFRPMTYASLKDDLEIAVYLLTSTAQTAALLLKHNLSTVSNPALTEPYHTILTDLGQQINQLAAAQSTRQPM
ncbi:MAG: cyclodeaminase/cyclohydrolase family protein [Anaerolineae bacterium]|nr:cyclodeaminase/cyclohydrolase family protein [Anaerolineae bacterium]